MVFSSIIFIFAFLPITLLLYYIAPEVLKNPVLLLFSLIFYAWGEPVYVVLMIFSILFNYVMGLDIEERLKISKRSAKRSLIFAIVIDIGLLGFFKYYGFFAENLSAVLPFELPQIDVALPVGISFYTFQTLSYRHRYLPRGNEGSEESDRFRNVCDDVSAADRGTYCSV